MREARDGKERVLFAANPVKVARGEAHRSVENVREAESSGRKQVVRGNGSGWDAHSELLHKTHQNKRLSTAPCHQLYWKKQNRKFTFLKKKPKITFKERQIGSKYLCLHPPTHGPTANDIKKKKKNQLYSLITPYELSKFH